MSGKNAATPEPKKEPPEKIPYDEIVNYLNAKAGTSYSNNSRITKRHIKARWAEGFRLKDFEAVVDSRVDAWGKDPKMMEFIRPQTLFCTKFESYLQSTKPKQPKIRSPEKPVAIPVCKCGNKDPAKCKIVGDMARCQCCKQLFELKNGRWEETE